MWVIVHALSGLALGALAPVGVGYLVVGALLLHVALDLIPHWDYTRLQRRLWWASIDVLAAIGSVAALTLTRGLPSAAVLAAVVSTLPDLDVFDAVLPGGPRRRLFPSHWRAFPHGSARAAVGIPVQVVVMASCAAAVLAAA